MNHDVAATFLPDLLQGTLTGDRKSAVVAHAGGCHECQALSEAYRSVVVAFHADSDDEHPTSEELAQWVLGGEPLDSNRRNQIASHVKDCASCRMDTEGIRGAEAEVGTYPQAGSRRAPVRHSVTSISQRWLAVAAAITVAMLAYPAYIGLTRAVPVHSVSAASSGPQLVPMIQLQAPLRGDADATPILSIAPAQTGAVLAIDPSALIELSDETRVRFRVSAGTADLLAQEATMRELRVGIREAGMATLWIPASDLGVGHRTLHVSYGSVDESWQELFESPFVVERQPAP